MLSANRMNYATMSNMKRTKREFIITMLISFMFIGIGCTTPNNNASEMLREYAGSLANERGVVIESADTLEQTGTISEKFFPQGIIASMIVGEESDNPYLVVIESDDEDSALVKLRVFSCDDGEVKELGSQSFRYSDYAPDAGMIYKINSYIQNHEDKNYIVFEEYASQGAAANLDVWQTIYSVDNNELVKEKELGYQLMAGLATRWPQFFIDGEVIEGYAEANMSADDINALTAATEKNKEYSDKAMAQFTEIRNTYGLKAPANNLDLDFEYAGDLSIAQITIDCNTNEYSIKSGGIISGSESDDSANNDDSKTAADTSTDKDKSDVSAFAAYSKLLSDNEDSIRAYHWQNGNSEYGAKPLKPVSFCDINADGVPELFVMMETKEVKEHFGVDAVELCIYTYKNGELQEIPYYFSNDRLSYNHIVAYFVADAGNYVIYKGKDNRLNMYAKYGDASQNYYIFTFDVGADCNLTLTQTLKNHYSNETGTTEDIYYKDGEEISYDEGVSLFRAGFKDFEKPIIADLHDYNDSDISTLTNQFSESDLLSMSYEDAIAYCESQVDK